MTHFTEHSPSNSGVITCTNRNLTLTAGGGSNYTFTGPGGLNQTGSNNTASINQEGTYTVSIPSANGCPSSSTTTTVSSNTVAPGGVTLSNDGPITCAKTSVNLSAGSSTPNVSYSFSGPGVTSSNGNTATANQPGTYTVKVTGTNGCTASQTTTVQSNTTAPTASLSNNGPITCAQRTVTLTAGGGGTYAFSSGATPSGNTATVNKEGIYSVTVTSANGCTASQTTQVQSNTVAPQNVTLSSDGPLTCIKTSVNLTAGSSTGGVTYAFTGPGVTAQNGNTATANQPGTYSVRVTGTNGCTATQTTQVTSNTSPPAATLSNNGPISDNNQTVTLTAGGGGSYQFSQGATQQGGGNTATVTTPGVYQVTVTRADNGCTATASTTVTGGVNQTICRSGTAVINVVSTGNPVRYDWYRNGTNTVRMSEIANFQRGTSTASLTLINQQATASYYVRVTDADGSSVVYGPFKVTINMACNAYARMGAQEIALQITVLGNPIDGDQLRATVQGAAGKALTVQLLDLSGKPLRSQQWQQAESDQLIEWSMSGQASGVYLLQAVTETGRQSVKVIKP